mmetsp:Transcript_140440/g.436680  ORF Transcript_140440/g.436680 Transcript_140440/m.436680 type:complete len:386 (+) Transcript_140440:204-1361(+)|eukprot:CAMPEP_0204569254 /NCGR_PEP_ID=MMETSP0661-20131031/37642_1 /ASSEMBLY_ACC=CAM_ASM_000606 /TAXON_ID=109239 /ORGANISM="Alexandrium margalefi, Strain AMGDE01CS-322" /LENGTH=385 /DNA_ID=CAMNT_0051577347 /DNA_START=191 /DNA_END=1348 /DNA_ORIENTATION=+
MGSTWVLGSWAANNMLSLLEADLWLVAGIAALAGCAASWKLHAYPNRSFRDCTGLMAIVCGISALPLAMVCVMLVWFLVIVTLTWMTKSWAGGYSHWCSDSPYMQGYSPGVQKGMAQEHQRLLSRPPYFITLLLIEDMYWASFRFAMVTAAGAVTALAVYFLWVALKLFGEQITADYIRVRTAWRLNRSTAPWMEPLSEPPISNEEQTALQPKHDEVAFASNLSQSLWRNRNFSDCIVKAEGREWRLHRCILATASPVFGRMFASGLAESAKQEVHILESDASDVDSFLSFLYTGSVGNLQRSAASWAGLLLLADIYEVNKLVDLSGGGLQNTVTRHNVVEVLQFLKKWKGHSEVGRWQEIIGTMAEATPELRKAVTEFAFESVA